MEVRHLRLVKTIAEEKGITRSLDKLFLTQSAVSHQLKDIEERLGVKIFYRTAKQWTLTDEGKVLYDTAIKVLAAIEQATDRINQLREGSKGTIRINTQCFTSYHWLPGSIARIKMLYPNLDISIVPEGTLHPLKKLLGNELDLVIVSDPGNDKSIRYIELFKDELLAVLPAAHALAQKKFLRAQDFADQTLIIYSYPLETVTVYQHFLRVQQVQPAGIIAIPLTEAALEMVRAGMGILTMPRWALKAFTHSPELALVKIGARGLMRTHYAAIRHEDENKKHLRDFIQNLKEELAR